jgi:hypothetical protein
MWDQCAGAYDIPSAHEIDDDRAKEFFLPYGMEVAGCGGFLLPFSCLLMWTWGHLYRVHFSAHAVPLV